MGEGREDFLPIVVEYRTEELDAIQGGAPKKCSIRNSEPVSQPKVETFAMLL